MQLEEDLGYVISAETLTQFQKVKHYINYIEQVEGFKKDNNGQAPLPWFYIRSIIIWDEFVCDKWVKRESSEFNNCIEES